MTWERATFATRAEGLKIVGDWQKSSGSEVGWARTSEGQVALRNFVDPEGPALLFDPQEIDGFIAAVVAGDFNDMLTLPISEHINS